MLTLQKHLTGTYAKNLLADWIVMGDCIKAKSTWIKDTVQASSETNGLKLPTLTNKQVNDAFNGPFQHFFKTHLQAYAQISKVVTAIVISKDDLFKESEIPTNTIFNLPEKSLESIEVETLKELRNKLDSLTKEHYAQWESFIQNNTETLIQELKKHNVTLTDTEANDFAMNQPIAELEDLFINLKLTLPKLSKSAFDFQQYFILKTVLVSYNALSRTQQPHSEKEIDALLKTLHAIFKKINKMEKELLSTQEKSTNELVVSINWATEKKSPR